MLSLWALGPFFSFFLIALFFPSGYNFIMVLPF